MTTNKKIDVFIIISFILFSFSIIGHIWFFDGTVYSNYLRLNPIYKQGVVWASVSLLALMSLVIGLIRVKVKKKTRHLGFIPTFLLVTVESFFGFMCIAALSILVIIIFLSTYKYWK